MYHYQFWQSFLPGHCLVKPGSSQVSLIKCVFRLSYSNLSKFGDFQNFEIDPNSDVSNFETRIFLETLHELRVSQRVVVVPSMAGYCRCCLPPDFLTSEYLPLTKLSFGSGKLTAYTFISFCRMPTRFTAVCLDGICRCRAVAVYFLCRAVPLPPDYFAVNLPSGVRCHLVGFSFRQLATCRTCFGSICTCLQSKVR